MTYIEQGDIMANKARHATCSPLKKTSMWTQSRDYQQVREVG